MKLLTKDGGPDSPVDAYFLCEFKNLFSIALLKFNKGTREAFHTHAFNAVTLFLGGKMSEEQYNGIRTPYRRLPKFTGKCHNHRVIAFRDSWALTVRGPWDPTWTETAGNTTTTFAHGREILRSSECE
jgi:hypothetical protein